MFLSQMAGKESSELNFGRNLAQICFVYGFIWAFASSGLGLVSYGFLSVTTPGVGTYASSLTLWLPAGALLIAMGLFGVNHRSGDHESLSIKLAAFLISVVWLSMAWYLMSVWQLYQLSQFLLAVAILSLVLAFFSSPQRLLLSLPQLALVYIYVVLQQPELSALRIMLAFGVFPTLVAVMLYVLRALFFLAFDKHEQNRAFSEKIKAINHKDELTDIANRKGFDEVLKNAMHLSNRFHTPLSLVVVNLDAFQAYNRTHGEQAGDDCLKQVATFLLGQAKRSVDFVARTEGDEFSIILPGCDQHQAEMLINKVQMALQADHGQALGLASPLSFSYGLAVHHDDTPESLYRKAVQALAQAKDKGRNRYEVFNQII